jgi:hypothetical protein
VRQKRLSDFFNQRDAGEVLVSNLFLLRSQRLDLHHAARVSTALEPRIVLDGGGRMSWRVGDRLWSHNHQLLGSQIGGNHARGSFVLNEAVRSPMIENRCHDEVLTNWGWALNHSEANCGANRVKSSDSAQFGRNSFRVSN